MPYENANLHLRKFRKDDYYAVVMELPERVEYFLSYHKSFGEAEIAFASALNLKDFICWRDTLLEFVLDYLSKSELTITESAIKADIISLGLKPSSYITDELKNAFKDRYKHLR